MDREKQNGKVKVTVYVDKELMRALRHYLVDADRSMASAFTEAIVDFLKKHSVNVMETQKEV